MVRKAQINFEFMAAVALYLIAIGAILTTGSDVLPTYENEADRASLNMEARTLTNMILTQPGSHKHGSGGEDWASSDQKTEDIENFGLAEDFLELKRSKIESLSSNPIESLNDGKVNYSAFKELTGVKSQYRFNFTWMPTVQTNKSFVRGSPPVLIDEEPNHDLYDTAGNDVHYGSVDMRGDTFNFLVTSHNGVFNTTYVSENNWDFESSDPLGLNDRLEGDSTISNADYRINSFQNRGREPGSLLILSKHIKSFGATLDNDKTTIKIFRFAEMENEPVRMEVWAW